jgi:hypothetical protein
MIIDKFAKMGLLLSELRLINNWRLYFQVNEVSDLANAAGTEIKEMYRHWATQEKKAKYNQPSKLNWPGQTQPGQTGHRTWAFCLLTCILKGSGARCGLQQPLGNWLVTPPELQSKWNEYINIES